MLVIWGRNNSVNVQKVLWCCAELGIEYERIDAGSNFGVVNTPEYRRLNANGLVPTIDDNGFVLWESNAIVRYLAAKHGTPQLWPDDPMLRAKADQWMDWTSTTFWPAIRPLFLGMVRNAPDERNHHEIEASRIKTGEVLRVANAHLESHEYLGGADFSVGDIPLGCAVWRWMALPIERPELPNLQRWFVSLTVRSAFKDIVMLPLS
ncbi:MAG: glutathione S-transferase family protein [Casimicrobiaceae bacterium]